jgi:hypothetical protein
MSRKDYIALARALALAKPDHRTRPDTTRLLTNAEYELVSYYWRMSVAALGNVLAADNPRFDRARFERACCGASPCTE